jgi:uncharacterized membrane protein YagU involved in acid resistance
MASLNSVEKRNILATILLTGLLVGTLDALGAIIYFIISFHSNPVRIFQYIASSVFGKAAYSGEISMIIYGVIFHYFIAYAFTTFFFLIYRKINILSKNPFVTGIFYGLFIWLIMNLIVVPIAITPKPLFNVTRAVINVLILILAIGLPLSFVAKKHFSNKSLLR